MKDSASYMSDLMDDEKYLKRRLAQTSDQKTINLIKTMLKQVCRDIEIEEKREIREKGVNDERNYKHPRN